jgi:ABC-type multidrug transport system permease subunit
VSPFALLVRLRLRELWRSPASLALYFGLPLALFLLLGSLFVSGHPFEVRAVAVVKESFGQGASLEPLLSQLPGVEVVPADSIEEAARRLHGREVSAVLEWRPSGSVLRVGERESLWAEGAAQHLPGVKTQVERLSPFGYVHFLLPGVLALAVLFGGLYGMGYNLVRYRQGTFLQKLATTPLSRSAFVSAQVFARALLVSVQVLLLVLAAWLVFDLPLSLSRWLAVLAVSSLGLLCWCGVGFALACVVRSEVVFLDVLNAIMSPTLLLSGVFFAPRALPAWLAPVAENLPSTQLVALLRRTLLYGEGLSALWSVPGAALCLWGCFGFLAGVYFFDFRRAR